MILLGCALALSLALNLWQHRSACSDRRKSLDIADRMSGELRRLTDLLINAAILRVLPEQAEDEAPARSYGTDEDEWSVEQLRRGEL